MKTDGAPLSLSKSTLTFFPALLDLDNLYRHIMRLLTQQVLHLDFYVTLHAGVIY